MKRQNIEVMIGWLDALRRGDAEAVAAGLAPGVRWQGLRPEIGCDGAEEVAREFARQRDDGFEIDTIELIGAETHAVMAIHMPKPRDVDGIQFDAIYNIFAIADGKITRIEDYTSRDEALAAAGLV